MRINLVLNLDKQKKSKKILKIDVNTQLCSSCLVDYANDKKNIQELTDNLSSFILENNGKEYIKQNVAKDNLIFRISEQSKDFLNLKTIKTVTHKHPEKANHHLLFKQGKENVLYDNIDTELLNIIDFLKEENIEQTNNSELNAISGKEFIDYLNEDFCKHNGEIERYLPSNVEAILFTNMFN